MRTRVQIIPKPVMVEDMAGWFTLSPATEIIADTKAREAAVYLATALNQSTGFSLKTHDSTKSGSFVSNITLTTKGTDPALGDEGYELVVQENQILARAPQPAGLFYGVQTLRQLFPSQIVSTKRVTNLDVWRVPCCRVWDKPRYAWRGFMLDSSRHFQSKDFVLRILDELAALKLNVFHWHFVDYNAWRVEIKKHPELLKTRMSNRWYSQSEGNYTQADIREVMDRAKQLHITVMPEIEMPGHSTQAVASIQDVVCQGPDGKDLALARIDEYCLGSDKTVEFLRDVLDEMLAMFPDSPYIHIGGDEAVDTNWKQCPRCQARMKEIGTDNPRLLQKWFMKKMADGLREKGCISVAWADNLELGIPDEQIVHGWHAGESEYAVRHGFKTIHGAHDRTYFDYCQGPGDTEYGPPLGLEKVYEFDPDSAAETPEHRKLILGSEGHLWTELVTEDRVFEKTFPRLLALSEVVWTPQEDRQYPDFIKRLKHYLPRLDAAGVTYYMDPVLSSSRSDIQ